MTIGLTGGIGSGKTTIAQFFKAFNIPVYTADEASKRLMEHNPIKEEIIDFLGPESYTSSGRANRKYIASKVFRDKNLLEKLNSIIHPRVNADYQRWLSRQKAPYILYEAAILFETGRYKSFDFTILVTAPKSTRISRLKTRDQATKEQIETRMENQWPDKRKQPLADWVIDNRDKRVVQSEISKIHMYLLSL